MQTRPTIALLSDFGHLDPYVAIMKGVLLSRCPEAQLLDLTHGLAPGDIGAAAFWLSHSRNSMPQGTVFLCVVDPTVGTSRRALCVRVESSLFIGPDNGLFADVLRDAEAQGLDVEVVEIDPAQLLREGVAPQGSTFHGRDLFAPAAALAAAGARPVDLGWPLPKNSLELPVFQLDLHQAITVSGKPARVRIADRFGNLLTDFLWASDDDPIVMLSGGRLPWVRTYAEAPTGRLVALRGSFNTVEIALQGESAHAYLIA